MNTTLGPAKAVSAGFFGAVTIMIVWAVQTFAGVQIPPEIASAFTVITSTAATWLTPTTSQ